MSCLKAFFAALLLVSPFDMSYIHAEDGKAATPSQPPQVLMCVPLGTTPGQSTRIKARGLRLDGTTEVRSNTAGVNVKFLSQSKVGVPASLNANQTGDTQVEFELTVDAASSTELEAEVQFLSPLGSSTYRLPIGDAKQTIQELEPNPGFKQSQKINIAQVILGQIERAQDVDVYSVELLENSRIRIEVAAARHGSALDSLVSLTDSGGTPLKLNDDVNGLRDSQIEWIIPKSGQYFVVVQDADDHGGEAHPYRLSLREVDPPVSFVRDVAPILQQRCVTCHCARKSEGGYRLDTIESLIAAGDSGARGFVANRLRESESYRRIMLIEDSDRMPLNGEPLADKQIALIRRWLEEGMHFDDASPTATLITLLPLTIHPLAPIQYTAPMPVSAVAFSPNGSELLVSGYHEITVWEPTDGRLLRRIGQVAQRTYKIAFHPTANQFAVASGNPGELGEVRLFSLGGELQKVMAISTDVIHDIAYSPDGELVAVACSDATIRVYDLSSGALHREISSHLDWVMAVAWSPDGSKLASASRDKTAKVFSVETGALLATYTKHEAAVRGVMFHPSGDEIYTSGANQRWDRWKISEAKQVRDMNLGGEAFRLSSTRSYFLVPTTNNRVHLMKSQESDRVRELQGSEPSRFFCVAAHELSDRVAAGTQRGDIVIWELSTGKKLAEFPAHP